MFSKCTICGKGFEAMEEYNRETEDIATGFEWLTIHKKEYCTEHEDFGSIVERANGL
ncbi:hypothetical protein [Priestia megaterium]|uniref:hypothetical protein n=1 Tax=Priestia megaterium TaxID=1404 RepID=UPI0015E4003D|nr:hypothetical protein [Priestia megaterium]